MTDRIPRTPTTVMKARRPTSDGETFDEVVVDAFYAQLLRHHLLDDEDDLADAVAFSQDAFTQSQLSILLKRRGRREPLTVRNVNVERRRKGLTLRASMWFDMSVQWADGRLMVGGGHLPDTVATAAEGRPLTAILDHPYVPHDLRIARVSRDGQRWAFAVERFEPSQGTRA